MNDPLNLHATGLLLGTRGLLIRGPSGAGKSLLALALLTQWDDLGREAQLISDDRIELRRGAGQLIMSAPPNIGGMLELRGRGVVGRPVVASAMLDLVIDLVPELVRMPEAKEFEVDLLGIGLARCPVPAAPRAGLAHQVLLVREAIRILP